MSPGNYSDRIQGLNSDSLGFDIIGTSNPQLGGYFSILYSLEQATIGGSNGLTVFMKLVTRVWPVISCPVRLKLAFTLGYVNMLLRY